MTLTDDPGLHLLLDDRRLDPTECHDNVTVFRLPATLFKGFRGPIELVLDLGGTAQHSLFGDTSRVTAA